MKKIIVIGCPGSGKSTFSKKLHKITGIELYHLDNLYWNADKTTIPKELFRERLFSILKEDTWIIDGNYNSTLELRMRACDTVIFLDYSTSLCLSGIAQRKNKVRSDMPWIETEDPDPEFIRFVENFNTESRPQILALLERYTNKKCVIFNNRQDATDFINELELQFQGQGVIG